MTDISCDQVNDQMSQVSRKTHAYTFYHLSRSIFYLNKTIVWLCANEYQKF